MLKEEGFYCLFRRFVWAKSINLSKILATQVEKQNARKQIYSTCPTNVEIEEWMSWAKLLWFIDVSLSKKKIIVMQRMSFFLQCTSWICMYYVCKMNNKNNYCDSKWCKVPRSYKSRFAGPKRAFAPEGSADLLTAERFRFILKKINKNWCG